MDKLSPKKNFQILMQAKTVDEKTSNHNILELSVEKLFPYPNHPFKPYSEDKIKALAKSIEINGLIHPIIVMKKEEDYIILSGHNRTEAYRYNNVSKISAIVLEKITKAEADLIMVESNLLQRDNLLPSEKSQAYKIQNEARKVINENTEEIIDVDYLANDLKISKSKLYLYISLCDLIPALLDAVDRNMLSIKHGSALSKLSDEEQKIIYDFFFVDDSKKLSDSILNQMLGLAKNNNLTRNKLIEITQKKKKLSTKIQIPYQKVEAYIGHLDEEDREDYILEAVEFYFNKEKIDK